jgi:hypothetical protein
LLSKITYDRTTENKASLYQEDYKSQQNSRSMQVSKRVSKSKTGKEERVPSKLLHETACSANGHKNFRIPIVIYFLSYFV